MSLDHTMILGVYQLGAGNTTLLKVTQGGHVSVQMRQQVSHNNNNFVQQVKQMIVWNGNIYFPFGSVVSNANGWACYNPELGEFETASYNNVIQRLIPLADRIGFFLNVEQGWGFSPEDKEGHTSDVSSSANDYVTVGEDVYLLNLSSGRVDTWAYPFTSPPAAGPAFSVTIRRLAELGGEVFGVHVNSAGGTLDLYKLVGGVLTLQGTPTAHSSLTNYDNVNAASQALFKFNNKLFFAVNANVVGQLIRDDHRYGCFNRTVLMASV